MTPVVRLLLNFVRCSWLRISGNGLQVYVFLHIPLKELPSVDPRAWLIWSALILAVGVKPKLESRELCQLPVSRRTWWISRWWILTVGTALLAALAFRARLGEISSASGISGQSVLLTMIAATAYNGAAISFKTRTPLAAWPLWVVIFSAPFFLAPHLPHAFGEITWGWLAGLVMLVVLSVPGFTYQPPVAPRNFVRTLAPPPVQKEPWPAHASSQSEAKPNRADRLTGIPLMMWLEARYSFWALVVLVVILTIVRGVSSGFMPVPEFTDFISNATLHIFNGRAPHPGDVMLWGFGWFFLGMFASASRLAGAGRYVKTLPMSPWRIAGIPLALGFASVCGLTVVLLALHALLWPSWPTTARVDLLLMFGVFNAMRHAMQLGIFGQLMSSELASCAPAAIASLAAAYMVDEHIWNANIAIVASSALWIAILALTYVALAFSLTRGRYIFKRPVILPEAGVILEN